MNARSWQKLETLASKCAAALRDPARQSEHIWRGEMWAVISAHHDIKKARSTPKQDARGIQATPLRTEQGQAKGRRSAE